MRQIDRSPRGFRLDRQRGKVMGVCAGLANRFGMTPLAWRLIFVAGTLFGFGSFVLIYLVVGLLYMAIGLLAD